MYIPKVEIRKSNIDGKGGFALEPISEGAVVWIYKVDHDLTFSPSEYRSMSLKQKEKTLHSAYMSPWSGL